MSDCEYILENGDRLNYNQMRKHLLENYDKLVDRKLKGKPQGASISPTQPDSSGRARKVFLSFLQRSTNLDAEQRARIERNPNYYYKPVSFDEVRSAAQEIIQDLGMEEAIRVADSELNIPESVKMAILGEGVIFYGKESKTNREIDAYNKFEEVFAKMAAKGTSYGQAISQIKSIYRLSGLAAVQNANKRIIENLNLSDSDISEAQQDIIDALEQQFRGALKEQEQSFEEKLAQLAGQVSQKAKGAIDTIDEWIKKLQGNVYDASLGIPVEILIGGLKMVKWSIMAGLEAGQAIKNGVNEIKKQLAERGISFDKEKQFEEYVKQNIPEVAEMLEEEKKPAPQPRPRELKLQGKKRLGALDEFAESIPLSDGANQNYVEEIKQIILEDNKKVKLDDKSLNKTSLGKLIKRLLNGEKLSIDDKSVTDNIMEALGWKIPQKQAEIIETLSEELLNPELPFFIKAQYEEIIHFILDLNKGLIAGKAIDDYVHANMLSGLLNNFVNLLGGLVAVTSTINAAIKSRNLNAFKVAANELKFAYYEASTIMNLRFENSKIPVQLGGGRVSRGKSYQDLLEVEAQRLRLFGMVAVSTGIGEASFRTLEYTPVIKKRGILARVATSKVGKSLKIIGRGLEAADTFPSAVISGVTDYYHIQRYINKFYPNATEKQKSQIVFDVLYSANSAQDYAKAESDLRASGISNPTKREIYRTVYERLTRARDKKIKELYDIFYEQKKQDALAYLKDNNLPVNEDNLRAYTNLMAGTFTPVVGRGQLQAQRSTGKLSTYGITSIINSIFSFTRQGLNREIEISTGLKKASLQATKRLVFVLGFPFQESIGRWVEMGLELTPYGAVKGLAYKASAMYTKKNKNEIEAERINDMANDFLLRAAVGTAIVWASPIGYDDDDDKDEEMVGTAERPTYGQERVAGAGLPKQSVKVGEDRRISLAWLGNIGIAFAFKADIIKTIKQTEAKNQGLSEEQQESIAYKVMAASVFQILDMAASGTWIRSMQDYSKIANQIYDNGNYDKLGSRVGRMMAAHIPYNRLQQEIAQLMNPKSETSKGFQINVVNQFSIVKGFTKGKANFDFRGREYDYGDIYINSIDGVSKFITGRKYRDEIDEWLTDMNFAVGDALQPKSEEISTYMIFNKGEKPRAMTEDEWYDFKKITADTFNKNITVNYGKPKMWEKLNPAEKRALVSHIMTTSRQVAAAKMNKMDLDTYLDFIGEAKEMFNKDKGLLNDAMKEISDNFKY